MAIYHYSTQIISRRAGRTSIACAAYRAGESLTDERLGQTFDYTRRDGVVSSEIVLPQGLTAAWAQDRSQLWNAAERAERRHDARVAREIEISLPHELPAEARQALAREFAQHLADKYGVAVDMAIHAPSSEGDQRNHHAHLLLTTREVKSDGLGKKSSLEMHDFDRVKIGAAPTKIELKELRQEWADMANRAMEREGLVARVDHRSFADRMVDLLPTQHQGIAAVALNRIGFDVDRQRLDDAAREHNARKLAGQPDEVLKLLDSKQSTFTKQDIARQLATLVDDAATYQAVLAKVMESPSLVELQAGRRDHTGETIEPAIYSTRRMVVVEKRLADHAREMAADSRLGVRPGTTEAALAWKAMKEGWPTLSDEQARAVRHITGAGRLKAVVGVAGSGKSTMLDAAREAWEHDGYKVIGMATTRQAARNLQESAGIPSSTMQRYVGLEAEGSAFKGIWAEGKELPDVRTIIVIDEAGLASSRLMQRTLAYAEGFGAKVVLVGDHEQLQSIGAGAAFRTIVERHGAEGLAEVRRQREDWQRQASVAFGESRTADALKEYADRGRIELHPSHEKATTQLVTDYQKDALAHPDQTRLALAYRHADVNQINDTIRDWRQQRGELGEARTYTVQYSDRPAQQRTFAEGDRMLFKQNSKDGAFKGLEGGIENGDLGTLRRVGDQLTVTLDRKASDGRTQSVTFDPKDYRAFNHGYAATVDSKQGVTVDRTFNLGDGMDKHRAYVTMTRHREDAKLYVSREQYRDVGEAVRRMSEGRAKTSTLDFEPGAIAERRQMAEAKRPERVTPAPAEKAQETPALSRQDTKTITPSPDSALERARDYAQRAQDLKSRHAALPDNGFNRSQRRELEQKMTALGRDLSRDREALKHVRERSAELGIAKGHALESVARGHSPERSLAFGRGIGR